MSQEKFQSTLPPKNLILPEISQPPQISLSQTQKNPSINSANPSLKTLIPTAESKTPFTQKRVSATETQHSPNKNHSKILSQAPSLPNIAKAFMSIFDNFQKV